MMSFTAARYAAKHQDPRWETCLHALAEAWDKAGPAETLAALHRTINPDDDESEALAYLARGAEIAGDLAAGNRALIRTDASVAAYSALTRHMPPEIRDELGRMLANDTVTREARAAAKAEEAT